MQDQGKTRDPLQNKTDKQKPGQILIGSILKKEKPIWNWHRKTGTVSHKEQLAENKEQQKRDKKKKEKRNPLWQMKPL